MSVRNPDTDTNLLELPPEIILLILKILVTIDPITLLGSVPGVCKRLRALCSGVHGTFNMGASLESVSTKAMTAKARLFPWTTGPMTAKVRLFPWTTGLWTFSRFPLLDSCKAGLLEVTDALLKEDVSKMTDEVGNWSVAPIYIACEYGHLELVRLLVEKGVLMNRPRNNGATPLSIACEYGHLEIVRLLAEKGAYMDRARNGGATPLSVACENGHLEIVRLLAEKGAYMNYPRKNGATPLYIACVYGHLEIVRLLLEKGVYMDRERNGGATPLFIARYQGHAEIVSLLKQAGARE